MIEELIAEEMELQAMSKLQAVSDEQQTQRLRQKQQDELIDDLVTACRSLSLLFIVVTIIVPPGSSPRSINSAYAVYQPLHGNT